MHICVSTKEHTGGIRHNFTLRETSYDCNMRQKARYTSRRIMD